jgi:tellurite resistance protein TerC
MTSVGSPGVWLLFSLVVILALAIDLGLFHREAREMRMRESAIWVGVWCTLATLFNGFIFYHYGSTKGFEFTQGYLLEFALSTDNLFVFLLIFSYFKVPRAHQRRILFWGILGAVFTRGVFIGLGAAIITRFHFVLYGLAVFLIFAAWKLVAKNDEEMDPSKNLVLRLFKRMFRTIENHAGPEFTIKRDGKRYATPLLAVLVVIEAVDVTFAVDSIPAIFGVTTDVFIVLTSNIFAILGLRSLYFLLEGLAKKLQYLNYGIAVVLAFIGVKILLQAYVPMPVFLSLGIVVAALGASAGLSLLIKPKASDEERK